MDTIQGMTWSTRSERSGGGGASLREGADQSESIPDVAGAAGEGAAKGDAPGEASAGGPGVGDTAGVDEEVGEGDPGADAAGGDVAAFGGAALVSGDVLVGERPGIIPQEMERTINRRTTIVKSDLVGCFVMLYLLKGRTSPFRQGPAFHDI